LEKIGKVLVNRKSQQDANDVFTFLVDQVPSEIRVIFKGTFLMTIEGISENDIRSTTTEGFSTLDLNVKTLYDLEHCFADSLEC
jgi:hypothetical protein